MYNYGLFWFFDYLNLHKILESDIDKYNLQSVSSTVSVSQCVTIRTQYQSDFSFPFMSSFKVYLYKMPLERLTELKLEFSWELLSGDVPLWFITIINLVISNRENQRKKRERNMGIMRNWFVLHIMITRTFSLHKTHWCTDR